MTHNPYSPPAASVVDVPLPDRGPRPHPVKWAVGMMWTSLILECVEVVSASISHSRPVTPGAIFGLLLGFTIGGWLYYKLWMGRNWARITLLILIVISLPIAIQKIPQLLAQGPVVLGLHVFENAIEALAIYLVFVPGRRWFAQRS